VSVLTQGARVLADRLAVHTELADPAAAPTAPDLPEYIVQALARLRLLHGVPFAYLVPDPVQLPVESARFFTLDAAWLDRLCAGALAVGGGGGTRERAQVGLAEAGLAQAQGALGRHLPLVRDLARGRAVLEPALRAATTSVDPGAVVTGMLIRSALVAGWPGLQVRAYVSDDPALVPPGADPDQLDPALSVPLLRLERLDPAVLLVLFAGVPELIWLEEPHHTVQFGVRPGAGGAVSVPIRSADGLGEVGAVDVPFRAAGEGVVDIAALAARLDGTAPLAHPRGSAALALSLLAPPARQRFGAHTPPEAHP
jgi:hypothetical protein